MRIIFRVALLVSLGLLVAHAQDAKTHWPVQDGNYVIRNFHFSSGESLPELKLHYLTLGKPHRDAAGEKRWQPIGPQRGAKPWSDDFSNILSAIRW